LWEGIEELKIESSNEDDCKILVNISKLNYNFPEIKLNFPELKRSFQLEIKDCLNKLDFSRIKKKLPI
jgi:hypothetical protein